MKIPTADELAAIPNELLRRWCGENARYGLVTQELVSWLRGVIGGRHAIEIGAGMGDLGRALGIPMTDSARQTDFEMRLYYMMIGRTVTDPPPDVERIDASQAVAKYKPQVVIASWVTQLALAEDEVQAFVYGVDEEALLEVVDTYIHIGNIAVHGKKRILSRPHKVYAFPWLYSSALRPELNRIWVWHRRR